MPHVLLDHLLDGGEEPRDLLLLYMSVLQVEHGLVRDRGPVDPPFTGKVHLL